MKRFCVIGLGNFGFHVAKTLYQEGHEVIAIDLDRDKIQRIKNFTSYAVLGDASNKEFLKGQGIGEMEAVIISTGERSHLSTLITLHLREMSVKRILVKAVDEDHGRILEKVGATDIIFPEKDMAIKTAKGLCISNILEFIPIAEDYSISEVAPPNHFVGHNLIDLDLRRKYNVTVIGIRDMLTGEFNTLPDPTHIIKDSDLMVMIGKTDDVEKACRLK
ncbi:TrkA family potassium uptake protein [Desulfuromonas sp. CSMB_57]|jgi:trk system potassium uptake protein TrkA|uniref:potassium channel family protein n=1 Tax=Desulfuromonas sp. CSMB_57 TaxID=2807629 RepID=UPI001CD77F12|nr:TrkA family potassium uptake protein [Desulfuromonas sp. CSMB_57]